MMLTTLLDALINMTAYVVVQILNHPDVQDAILTAIQEGAINKLF